MFFSYKTGTDPGFGDESGEEGPTLRGWGGGGGGKALTSNIPFYKIFENPHKIKILGHPLDLPLQKLIKSSLVLDSNYKLNSEKDHIQVLL